MAGVATFDVKIDEVPAGQNVRTGFCIPQEFLKVIDHILFLFILLAEPPSYMR
jgi:hypothetical protein